MVKGVLVQVHVLLHGVGVGVSDAADAAALSTDLKVGGAPRTAAKGIFLKSTTRGAAVWYEGGLKLCNVGGTLGVVDTTCTITSLTLS